MQEGETGLDEVTYENVYYGDSATANEVNEIERVTLKAPVTRVIDKGPSCRTASWHRPAAVPYAGRCPITPT